MVVEFCPECGNMLSKSRDDGGKIELSCRCGYCKPYEKTKRKKKITKYRKKNLIKKTVVIEDTNQQTYPTTEVACPECGHMKAEYFQQQTRSADEPPTTFYRCLKCDHRWRAY